MRCTSRERRRTGLVVAIVLALACGCSGDKPQPATQPQSAEGSGALVVYVVNYPLKYFAERIGGDGVKVVLPAPTDVDPASWRPNAEEVLAYQAADLVLLNGAGYAKWVEKATLSPSRTVNTSSAFRERHLKLDDAVRHTHGPEGEHEHGTLAFTTWLDMTLAVEQARAIKDALVRRRPDHAPSFEAGFAALGEELVALDEAIRDCVSKDRSRPVVFSHPVFQYMTRRYGLNSKSVHWEPDEMPSQEMWRELEALKGDHPVRWMIWEGTPADEIVERLRQLGVESAVFSPCANVPEEGDYLSVMRANVDGLRRVFGP